MMRKFVLSVVGMVVCCNVVHAQSFGPRVNAALVITSAEKPTAACTGNDQPAWVVLVSAVPFAYGKSVFVPSFVQCAVVRIKMPIGSKVTVGGLFQLRLAQQGFRAINPTVDENCFNVEVYSVGLVDDPQYASEEIDPTSQSNIVNPQGYGLLWDMTDMFPEQGTRVFDVKGCNGACPQSPTMYNTDFGTLPNNCQWVPAVW